ncbi:hypothetical protein [Jeotgalibacillus sp. JSM ZJ347]|uniref:hypothetical protein n=1 Tax=Jeotgalibacillus sp. JSM ZJ347 TaxID=3342117 RepID=UPI0035A8364F
MAVKTESTAAVEKKAKAYKRILEHCAVNPHFCIVNGDAYYRVVYQRNQGVKGSAILTAGESRKPDAITVFPQLVLFNELIYLIYESVNHASGIPDEVFTDPLDLIKVHNHVDMTASKNVIEQLYDQHLAFSEQYKRFKSFVAEPHQIFDEDVEILQEYAAYFHLLRYHMLKIATEQADVVTDWIDKMKKAGAWHELTDLHRGYYEQIVSERDKNLKSMHQINVNPLDTEEEQIRMMMQTVIADGRKILEAERQRLRWPEL